MKSDLYSIDENGVETDRWIFEELLGADDLPDPYAYDLDSRALGNANSGRYRKGSGQNPQSGLGSTKDVMPRAQFDDLYKAGWRFKPAGLYQSPGAPQAHPMWRVVQIAPTERRPFIFIPPEEPRSLGGPNSGRYRKGSHQNPLSGERHGTHTPQGLKKLISYLEKTTGEKFKAHGSVSKGHTSTNDFDLVMQQMTEEEQQQAGDRANQIEQDIWEQVQAGKISQDEAMQQLYGDAPADPIEKALTDIGFVQESAVAFDGTPTGTLGDPEVEVHRFRNPVTGHSIEIWVPLLPRKEEP